jgi:hyperosmotically inducible protein
VRTIKSIAALLAIGVMLAACSATDTRRSTGEYVDDSVLTGQVKAALAEDKTAKAHQVDVEVNRGVVQLNGFVDSEANRAAAVKVAKNVEGVKEVRNNLSVRAEDTPGNVIDDSVITAQVKSKLLGDSVTKGTEINVETQGGVVQLSGFVDSSAQRTKATALAREVDGVKEVRNQIDVKPTS